MTTLGTGQLARRAGVAIDTVRYYERNQLLTPAGRLASGYRRYGEGELKRLRFIRRAKALGFTLEEIRELLSLSDERNVAKVKRAAEAKLADIGQRLSDEPITALIMDTLEYGSAVALADLQQLRALPRGPIIDVTGTTVPNDDQGPARAPSASSGKLVLAGPERLVISIPAVASQPLGLSAVQEADAVVICIELGRTKLAAARKTVEVVGRERLVGCFLVR